MAESKSTFSSRHAFTLIELLVVIGIAVLLMGLLLAAVTKSYKAGVRTRQSADLTLIATALEAYKADFGDYPRFATAADDQNSTAGGDNGQWLDYRTDRGAILLCRTLLGPGPLNTTNAAGGAYVNGQDGAVGNGFRTRPGGAGTVYGPYIQPDKFQIGTYGAAVDQYFSNAMILDRFGKPILYYPASPGASQITTAGGFSANYIPSFSSNDLSAATPAPYPLYNAFDNLGYGTTTSPIYLSESSFQKVLGDVNNKGYVGYAPLPGTSALAVTQATYTGAYLLWSAGPDGNYGLDSTGKTDDITNFDIPPNLRK